MIRLTLLLCAGLFVAMLIAGRDHGQLRFGLMDQAPDTLPLTSEPTARAITPLPAKADVALFAPAAPVMATPVVLESTAAAEPAVVAASATGKVLFIGAKSVNVREGPGKDFAVVGRLARGEAVLVVAEGDGNEGWSLIRIEGDGVEGYVATRLLTE